ncbi:hypothetical protein BN2475_180001 [Paraburkholderia ribeironis]|uniref:Uncharacterized protein n=1 Tax=Paraburkholderia ribeironis TaxID=1247936 RepID=A0A1N7RUQ4_9BURK|nr:hypothetical protein BN2475_180001 [Paraburkholderia ribeironis]
MDTPDCARASQTRCCGYLLLSRIVPRMVRGCVTRIATAFAAAANDVRAQGSEDLLCAFARFFYSVVFHGLHQAAYAVTVRTKRKRARLAAVALQRSSPCCLCDNNERQRGRCKACCAWWYFWWYVFPRRTADACW